MSDETTSAASPPSMQVQTVLYGNDGGSLERFIAGVGRSVALARAAGRIGEALLLVGDSSPSPLPGAETMLEHAAGAFDSAAYVHFGENLGHGGGHNRLAAGASVDLLLVINPDAYAGPRLVTELVRGLADDVGIVEARQLPLEHPKTHDPVTKDTSWASGACFLVRETAFAATGGFDGEQFFMHGDDVDLSWRIRLAGWRVVHQASATIFHDKRLNAFGQVVIGADEVRWSAEASVLLAWRYDERELALEQLGAMERSADPVLATVASKLRARIAEGAMPSPLEGAERVAQFVDGEYAVHRFSYRDP